MKYAAKANHLSVNYTNMLHITLQWVVDHGLILILKVILKLKHGWTGLWTETFGQILTDDAYFVNLDCPYQQT